MATHRADAMHEPAIDAPIASSHHATIAASIDAQHAMRAAMHRCMHARKIASMHA